jgi:hypothetical protein
MLLHTIRHNLGLGHASDNGRRYGDQTGYMGLSERSLHGPQRCFNAYNHWRLGWFQDKVVKMEHIHTPQLIELESFVDYRSKEINGRNDEAASSGSAAVLINLYDTYFIQYNRAKDHNIGTGEFKDGVTVVRDMHGSTDLVAGLYLSPSQHRLEIDTLPEHQLVIEVCDIIFDLVILSIGMDRSICDSYHAGEELPSLQTGTDSFQYFGRDSFQNWGLPTEAPVSDGSQSSHTGVDSFQNVALHASLASSGSPTMAPSALQSSAETATAPRGEKYLYEAYNQGVYSSKKEKFQKNWRLL